MTGDDSQLSVVSSGYLTRITTPSARITALSLNPVTRVTFALKSLTGGGMQLHRLDVTTGEMQPVGTTTIPASRSVRCMCACCTVAVLLLLVLRLRVCVLCSTLGNDANTPIDCPRTLSAQTHHPSPSLVRTSHVSLVPQRCTSAAVRPCTASSLAPARW